MKEVPRHPRGGARRPWRLAEYASLDFETTGLDLDHDHVISFGVVPIRSGRIMLGGATYHEVRPSVAPKPDSIVVHGLRPVDLADAPALHQVDHHLREALAKRYLVAWAAEVEASFLSKLFGRSPAWWRKRIIDVLRLAILADDLRGVAHEDYSLSAVASRLDVPVEQPHHALDDALTTAQVLIVLLPELERGGIGTPRRLLRASRA